MKEFIFKRPYAVVFLVLVMAAIFIYRFYGKLILVNWDEASFAHATYAMYQHIRDGDFGIFFKNTLKHTYYPFLQSWVMLVPALFFGFSIEKNRIYSLAWLLVAGLMVFYHARKINEDKKEGKNTGILGGYLSLLLFLTAPLVMTLACVGLKEMMGISLILIVFAVYFQSRKKNSPGLYLLTSLLGFILMMLKYNYGVITVGIIGIEAGFSFIFCRKRIRTVYSHALIFLPLLLLLLAWLYYPVEGLDEPKPQRFLKVIMNRAPHTEGMSDTLGYLLFYPRAIFYAYSFSGITALFLIAMVFLSIPSLKYLRPRLFLFAFLLNFGSITVAKWNMQERYAFLAMVFLYILAGAGGIGYLIAVYRKVKKMKLPVRYAFIILFLGGGAILVRDIVRLPQNVYSVAAYANKSPIFNQLDYRDLFFNYDRSLWAQTLPPDNYEKPADVIDFAVSQVDLTKPVTVIGQTTELAPDYFQVTMKMRRDEKRYPVIPDYNYFIITLEVLPGSKFSTFDYIHYNSYVYPYVKEVQANPNFTLLRQKVFADLGVEIRVYGGK